MMDQACRKPVLPSPQSIIHGTCSRPLALHGSIGLAEDYITITLGSRSNFTPSEYPLEEPEWRPHV